MPEIILSVDPGGTTGLAFLMPDGKYMTAIATTPEEVWGQIIPGTIDRVICENFAGQLISTYGLHTVRIIGGVMALCWKFGIPYQGRPPQARKAMLIPAREYLKANKGDTFVVHEVDALAHLMVWQHGHVAVHKANMTKTTVGGKTKRSIDFSKVTSKYDDTAERYNPNHPSRRGYGGFKRSRPQ